MEKPLLKLNIRDWWVILQRQISIDWILQHQIDLSKCTGQWSGHSFLDTASPWLWITLWSRFGAAEAADWLEFVILPRPHQLQAGRAASPDSDDDDDDDDVL